MTATPSPGRTAAESRDERQDQVRAWVVQCWGENAVGVRERVERFFGVSDNGG